MKWWNNLIAALAAVFSPVVFAALALPMDDPIAAATERFGEVESYRVTLRSRSDSSSEEIVYHFKKPGFVRMEFVRPHRGAALTYDPEEGKVRVRPFGSLESFILKLSPGNPLIRSSRGHRVDESDIGALLKNVRELQSGGKTEVLGEERVGGRDALVVRVEGEGFHEVDGIRRYILWLDGEILLPLKVAAYDSNGGLVEEVLMDDLAVNIHFPEGFFRLGR